MKGKLLGGTALLMAAFSLNEVNAQTCTIPPMCESLGYDRTEGECSDAVKSLRCPLDKDKVFCLTAAEVEEIVGTPGQGNKVAEIGDLVYTDIISAEPIPGRIPVGIVYDISGKMVSVAEYGNSDKCAEHTADGTTGWTLALIEDMGSIKANAAKINETIGKLGNSTPEILTKQASSILSKASCYLASNGHACMLSGSNINSSANYGCDDCQSSSNTYVSKSRCVRKFGPNGANDVVSTPTPTVTTYKVGDTYTKDGVALGKVVSVDSSGQHGVLAVSDGNATASEVSVACRDKTQGGLNWSLATGAHACTLFESIGSYLDAFTSSSGETIGPSMSCGLHALEGQGVCKESKWKNFARIKYSCDSTDTLAYVCEAPF